MIIVIDDERTFAWYGAGYGDIVYARTSDEGIAAISKGWTDFSLRYGDVVDLYLDHDLGGNDTIMPVVDFLYCMGFMQGKGIYSFTDFVQNIFVHSQNPTAADTIVPLLASYGNVKQIPLPELV